MADDLSFLDLIINYMKDVPWLQWRVNSIKKKKKETFGHFFNDITGLIHSLKELCCHIYHVLSLICLAYLLKERKFIKNTQIA